MLERNRPDDTFGFGVVFSDETLDTFEHYDHESYRAIIGHFAYWDDIEIHFRGTVHRIGGNGFCGCSRGTLLNLLGRRARSLGIEIRFQTEVTPLDPRSAMPISWSGRTASTRGCARPLPTGSSRPSICGRTSSPGWARPSRLDAFTFFFRETEHGIFIAHSYQYEPDRSTWVIETDPGTSRVPVSTGSMRRPRRASSRPCSPTNCRAIG